MWETQWAPLLEVRSWFSYSNSYAFFHSYSNIDWWSCIEKHLIVQMTELSGSVSILHNDGMFPLMFPSEYVLTLLLSFLGNDLHLFPFLIFLHDFYPYSMLETRWGRTTSWNTVSLSRIDLTHVNILTTLHAFVLRICTASECS